MYDHRRFVTSVRGIGELPTTAASSELGDMGFMNAGFGARFTPLERRFLDLRAVDFRAVFFRAVFFRAAPFRAVFFRAVLFRAPDFFTRDFDDFLPDDLRAELFFLVAIDSPGDCQAGEDACPSRCKLKRQRRRAIGNAPGFQSENHANHPVSTSTMRTS